VADLRSDQSTEVNLGSPLAERTSKFSDSVLLLRRGRSVAVTIIDSVHFRGAQRTESGRQEVRLRGPSHWERHSIGCPRVSGLAHGHCPNAPALSHRIGGPHTGIIQDDRTRRLNYNLRSQVLAAGCCPMLLYGNNAVASRSHMGACNSHSKFPV